MKKLLFSGLFLISFSLMSTGALTSCASRTHCPAVAGTGNSASSGSRGAKKKYCAGVKGTGTIKPKRKNRIEDGNFSIKTEKARLKAKKKNTSPIKQKKLQAD